MNTLITYETKCRRCGKLHDWVFADREAFDITFSQFLKAMMEKITYPTTANCKECKKPTLQDLVAYDFPDAKKP